MKKVLFVKLITLIIICTTIAITIDTYVFYGLGTTLGTFLGLAGGAYIGNKYYF